MALYFTAFFLLGNAHLSLFDNNNGTCIFRLTLCDINSKRYPT